jgi:hypothetical protein
VLRGTAVLARTGWSRSQRSRGWRHRAGQRTRPGGVRSLPGDRSRSASCTPAGDRTRSAGCIPAGDRSRSAARTLAGDRTRSAGCIPAGDRTLAAERSRSAARTLAGDRTRSADQPHCASRILAAARIRPAARSRAAFPGRSGIHSLPRERTLRAARAERIPAGRIARGADSRRAFRTHPSRIRCPAQEGRRAPWAQAMVRTRTLGRRRAVLQVQFVRQSRTVGSSRPGPMAGRSRLVMRNPLARQDQAGRRIQAAGQNRIAPRSQAAR